MASRAFKPSSFLASATQQSSKSSRGSRPGFARTDSRDSTSSGKSEDSFVSTLRSSSTAAPDRENHLDPATPVQATPTARLPRDETPPRKSSQPIAIEAPESWKKRRAYTPLSARGELAGGYFPIHGEIPQLYRPHPFSGNTQQRHFGHHRNNPDLDSPTGTMSTSSSAFSTPIADPTLVSSTYIPAHLEPVMAPPLGKYHPSNYKPLSRTSSSTPRSATPAASLGSSLPRTNLALPPTVKRQNSTTHTRNSSEVKRKLQQYQQNMIKQARAATSSSLKSLASSSGMATLAVPVSPRLLPAGSPGPITPFELEESATSGYILGGTRVIGSSATGGGLDRERERERLMWKLLDDEQRRSGVGPVDSV